MNDFLSKLLNSTDFEPPVVCKTALDTHFAGAMNTEWFQRSENYEVIFVKDSIEHIALFDESGTLIKYKLNLQKELLPALIIETLEKDREIMSAVLINEGHQISYEVIVRRNAIERYQVLVDEMGRVIKEVIL